MWQLILAYISGFTNSNAVRSNGTSQHNKSQSNSAASGRGLIPKARIKTIKMTLVIVLGKRVWYIPEKNNVHLHFF